MVEAARRDGLVQLLRGLQLGPGVFVPEAEASIWTHSGQSAVDRMEGDGVHLQGGKQYFVLRNRIEKLTELEKHLLWYQIVGIVKPKLT